MLSERKCSPKLYWKKMNQHGHHCGIKIVRFGRSIFTSVFRFWLGELRYYYLPIKKKKKGRAMSGHFLSRMTGSGRSKV